MASFPIDHIYQFTTLPPSSKGKKKYLLGAIQCASRALFWCTQHIIHTPFGFPFLHNQDNGGYAIFLHPEMISITFLLYFESRQSLFIQSTSQYPSQIKIKYKFDLKKIKNIKKTVVKILI